MTTNRTTFGALARRGALLVNDGYRTKSSELGRPGIPILRVAEVQDGNLSPTYGDHVRDEFRAKAGVKTSKALDVVITTKGTVGRAAIVPDGAAEFVYSPQVCFLRVLDDSLDPRWLYYWCRGPEFRGQALGVQAQTHMAAYINLADLRAMQLTHPPLEEQRGIAATLGALDDKIDSNRRQQAVLAELIEAEFGRIARTAADSVALAQLAAFTKGVSYKSVDLEPSSTALVTLKSFSRHGGYKLAGLKPYVGPWKPAQQLLPGELAVAQTDLTQAADVVGRVIRVPEASDYDTLVASLDLVIARPLAAVPPEFLLGVLLEARFRQHCRRHTSGTTVLHLASGPARLPRSAGRAGPTTRLRGNNRTTAGAAGQSRTGDRAPGRPPQRTPPRVAVRTPPGARGSADGRRGQLRARERPVDVGAGAYDS